MRSQKYKNITAVDGIDFTVRRGEFFGMLGPNGAGKTSVMKMFYNLVIRNGGDLNVLGMDPKTQEVEIKYRIGIVPQEDNLDPDLTVKENLEIYSNYFGIPSKISKERINVLFHFFDLVGKEDVNINELSGGMKRRLVIIRALLNDPELLLLDEPTTGLDPQARHLIWDKLNSLKKQGMTLVITTHYMDEASQLCDRIIIMNRGQIVIEGNPHKLMQENFEKYVLETENVELNVDISNIRHEAYGIRCFFYSNNKEQLFKLRDHIGNHSIIVRNSTLEDLFLKMTGRKLNE
ncbi:ATP-binding cassette domain-containing protein [bacterium]|nr:ATP-binding cassette domain-containing protein [bacterium]RQV97062.1 MAG: ATP-binding cassette domain-containing protein [bacterium]